MIASRRWIALALVFVGPSACSFLVSVDGLSDGIGTLSEAGLTEASPGPDSSSGSDAYVASDVAHQVDTGDPIDAAASDASAADAFVSGDADASAFCASLVPAPTFCDDFDVGALGQGWSSPRLNGFTLDSFAFSPPDSARALATTKTCAGPSLGHDESGSFLSTRLEMMLDPGLDDGGLNSETTIATLYSVSPVTTSNSCTLLVQQGDGFIGIAVQEFNSAGAIATSEFYFSSRYPIPGQWTKFAFQMVADGMGHPSLSAYVNDLLSIKATVRTGCTMGGATGFAIGSNCSKSGAAQMRFDNVRFDAK